MTRHPNVAHHPCCNVTQPRGWLRRSIRVKSLHLQLKSYVMKLHIFYKFYVFDACSVYTETEANP